LRAPFAGRKLTKSNGEIRIQINRRLRHIPYMVPYSAELRARLSAAVCH
jgi:hypothetical protein